MKTPAVALKSKKKEDRYLCDGIECGDWTDEQLDTKKLSDAMLIIRKDLTKPDHQDIKDFYKFIASLPLSNDVVFLKQNYEPVEIELTAEQLKIVRDRNEW